MNIDLVYPGKEFRLLTILLCLIFMPFFTFILSAQSIYTEVVTIPPFDAANSEHFLIRNTADWSHINDSDKRCFYVEPGAGCGTTTITADGSAVAPRYISLYNGNDKHPAQLDVNEQANVRLVFSDAHYWVVDRMSSIDYNTLGCGFIIENNAGNIILNRLYLTGFFDGIGLTGTDVAPYTSNNTIQNCRFDQMTPKGIDGDAVAIILTGGPSWNTPGKILNTKILNNEIKNCNDGIQTLKMKQFCGNGIYYVDYPGTIIDANHIYVDSTLYTDGEGNRDPKGLWALTENGIDLKGGSGDPENPMIISNNYIWGFRRTDTNGGGSGSWGGAIDGHFHVKNVEIVNNVIFDSNQGITFSDTNGTTPYSIENGLISGNILYNIGFETSGGTDYTSLFYDSKNVSFEANTIVGVNKNSRWFSHNYSEVDLNVSCNLLIDSYNMIGSRASTTTVGDNSHFNTTLQQSSDGEFYSNASDANMSDLTFTCDQLTNSPRSITLPGVVLSGSTPPPKGEIIWNNNLNDISDWKSEGKLSIEHLDNGVLRVFNELLSVYWVGEVFEAPVIFDFDVRTQDNNTRAILFFMAEGVNGEDVFSWARPKADYGDYAFYGRMQLYTVGMMRGGPDSKTKNNFRILPGKLPEHLQILETPYSELAEEQKPLYAKANEEFQPYSIVSTSNDDYELGEWQHYRILVDSSRIRVWADGKLLHDVKDNSLRKQGRIGFRNFRPNTAVEVRKLQAIRPSK